jgi:hypothetical protein
LVGFSFDSDLAAAHQASAIMFAIERTTSRAKDIKRRGRRSWFEPVPPLFKATYHYNQITDPTTDVTILQQGRVFC